MNELATQTTDGKIKDLIQSNQFKLAVASALPAHLKPERFIRVALTALTRTPKLAQCDQASFFQCLLTLSQFGLEPDGRNAHLIPFENRKRGVTECQVIIDYKGLADLAMRSGKVSYIHADKVCENDVFEYDRGQIKTHRINFKVPRGNPYAYYAICHFKDETEKCDVMTKDEVEKIRGRSRAGQSGPWVTDFDEMAKKTVFRRLSKWLQLSPEYRDALEADADQLEEHRFEAAMPVIGRAVIPANASRGSEEPPKTRGRKPKAQKESLADPVETSEFTILAQIGAKLIEAGYTEDQLLKIAIRENYCETTVKSLGEIEEPKLAFILKHWDDTLAELEQLVK